MSRRLVAVEKAGLREEHRAGAGARERCAARIPAPQARDLVVETAVERLAGGDVDVGDADDPRPREFRVRTVRLDPHAVAGDDRFPARRDDPCREERSSRAAVDDEAPIAAGRHEEVVQAEHDRRARLGERKDGDGRRQRFVHGLFVRFVAETATAPSGG